LKQGKGSLYSKLQTVQKLHSLEDQIFYMSGDLFLSHTVYFITHCFKFGLKFRAEQASCLDLSLQLHRLSHQCRIFSPNAARLGVVFSNDFLQIDDSLVQIAERLALRRRSSLGIIESFLDLIALPRNFRQTIVQAFLLTVFNVLELIFIFFKRFNV